jgi:hypothetical protein
VRVPPGTRTNAVCPDYRITNTPTSHDHGSSAFIIQLSSLSLRIPLSDPGHTDTGFMDKTEPHDPFLKDGAKRKILLLFTPTHGALHEARSGLFFRIIFFSKLSTIRQQSFPSEVRLILKAVMARKR